MNKVKTKGSKKMSIK